MRTFLAIASFMLIWHQTDALTKCPPQRRDPVTGVIRPEPVQVSCDFCVAFFDEYSSFMQACGSKLDEVVLDKLKLSCEGKKDSQIEAFFKNLEMFCEFKYKDEGKFEAPPTECGFEGCDICELVFRDDSDFSKNCGRFLADEAPEVLQQLRDDCELRECGTGGLVAVEARFLAECEARSYSFKFPECECNECFATFRSNSEFMQGCGSSFSLSNIDKYTEDCDAAIDDVDALLDFFTSLQEHCDAQGKEVFEIPTCNCDNVCWAIQDSFSDFYKDCFDKFDEAKQESLLDQCSKVVVDTTSPAFSYFVGELEHLCKKLTGRKTLAPRCLKCPLSEFDIVFMVDSSPSLRDADFDIVKDFVIDIASFFALGDDLTRVAVVNYADEAARVLELQAGNSFAEVSAAVTGMGRQPCFGACTNTPAAIYEMLSIFADAKAQGSTNPQISILLTDGFSNVGNLDQAVEAIADAGVAVFSVGVGGANEAQLLKIAGDVMARVFESNEASGLTSIIEDLRVQICS